MRKLQVLVVDDDPNNLEIARAILTRQGHDVVLAHNGAEAVEICSKPGSDFDLILMDITMPVLDGIEATARIRTIEHCKHTPLLYITGVPNIVETRSDLTLSGDHVLTKPYRRQQLLDAISALLAEKGVLQGGERPPRA